jgi:hypothetical protein
MLADHPTRVASASELGGPVSEQERAFSAVNTAFGSLGRACMALDADFRVLYASELLDTLLGPAAASLARGSPVEGILGSELFGADGPLRLAFLTVDGRRIAAGVSFETDGAVLYYNAGVDPEARELSPGVVMVERYVRRALEHGVRRLDFLRGNEPYKYEWGAADEPIQRLLVRRTESR